MTTGVLTIATEHARLIIDNPSLEPVAPGAFPSHTLAARNIHKELRAAFPGIKFSVRSSSFSMGDSVDVSWTDGPTTAEVDAIVAKYEDHETDETGDFRDPCPSPWTNTFGGTKYAMTQRSLSAQRYQEAANELFPATAPHRFENGRFIGLDFAADEQAKRAAWARSFSGEVAR